MKHFYLLTLALAGGCLADAMAEQALVFEESFSNCKSTTIQGGYFTESLYFDSATMGDNDGWYTQNCYMAERAIKFSAKTKHGNATTPAINLYGETGDITVEFRAQTWTGDDLTVNVEIVGDADSKNTFDLAGTQQITLRSEAPCIATFNDVPTGFQLKFSGTGKEGGSGVTRFFLSDIRVLQEVDASVDHASIHTSSAYQHFNDIMAGNESEVYTLRARTLGNVADNIGVELAADADFSYLGSDGPDADGLTSYNFGFTPHNAGPKENTVVLRAGNLERRIILTGNAKVYRPDGLTVDRTEANSFTASWALQPGMDNLELVAWTIDEGALTSPDLMIVKYIEGTSNNRAIELFNGTGQTVNLNGYKLFMELNGAGGLTSCEYALPAQDLAPGASFTIANAQYGDLRDIADVTIGYSNGGNYNIMTFTGDDAIGLFNPAGELIDLVGYESYDVNDRVDGLWGFDKTFYRRPEVYCPQPKFYPEEWIEYSTNHSEGFGQHEMDSYGDVRREVARVMLDGDATSATIEGLEPMTAYRFTLRGHSNGLTTHYAPVVTAVTAAESGVSEVSDAKTTSAVYTIDGRKAAINTLPAGTIVIIKAADGSVRKAVL